VIKSAGLWSRASLPIINSPTKTWLEQVSNRSVVISGRVSQRAACTVAVHATYPNSGRAAVLGGRRVMRRRRSGGP
jgi:hypothetical protein